MVAKVRTLDDRPGRTSALICLCDAERLPAFRQVCGPVGYREAGSGCGAAAVSGSLQGRLTVFGLDLPYLREAGFEGGVPGEGLHTGRQVSGRYRHSRA